MTDHDRGAYTPQTDAPLAFDARRVRGAGGGPSPVTLVVSGIVGLLLLIFLLLSWQLYRGGVRPPGQPPQVIGAPVGPTKAPASSDNANSGAAPTVQIDTTAPSASRPPTLAAGPEAPAARTAPIPTAPSTAIPPPPPPPSAASNLRQAQTESNLPPTAPDLPAPSAAAAHLAPAMSPPAITPARRAKASSLTPPALSAPAPPGVAAPAPGEPLVQIGAFSSAALAQKGWRDTAAVLPGRMTGRTAKVEKAERDGKTFYRSYVGGFATHAQAQGFCEALKAAGKTCIVR